MINYQRCKTSNGLYILILFNLMRPDEPEDVNEDAFMFSYVWSIYIMKSTLISGPKCQRIVC